MADRLPVWFRYGTVEATLAVEAARAHPSGVTLPEACTLAHLDPAEPLVAAAWMRLANAGIVDATALHRDGWLVYVCADRLARPIRERF